MSSMFDKCPACGKTFLWANEAAHHRCPPRWQCGSELEELDDSKDYFGDEARSVAENCAVTWFNENGCGELEQQVIYVRKVGEETIRKFEITIEHCPYASVTDEALIEPAPVAEVEV